MNIRHTIIFLCFLSFQYVFGQNQDNTWLTGYQGGNENFGITRITFPDGSFRAQKDTSLIFNFSDNNSVICDDQGRLFAVFDGFRLYDKNGGKMQNGDSLWYETLPYLYGYCDDDLPQGGLFLPWPGSPDSLVLFYTSQGNAAWPGSVDLTCLNLFYSIIQVSGNNGLGNVIDRRISIIDDTIQYGRLTASRHANGRDWWILINKRNSNQFYRILFDREGIHTLDSQHIGVSVKDGLGQAVFSPDGTKYVIKNSVDNTIGNFIDIYDFDRCTGYLSNHHQFHYYDNSIGGVAISPNSRYLYVTFETFLYQYDLLASNIEASRVLIDEYIPAPGFPTTFYVMQLAPDNKIYMCAPNSFMGLHVINKPDAYGLACEFEQRGIQLPTYNSFSLSFNPNFRLGPIDDSSCDSLGLDNIPKSWFRQEHDTLDEKHIFFTDLSYYEPSSRLWDFGDNSSQNTEKNPTHDYDNPGIYYVCLTTSNSKGSDTYCRVLYIGVSKTSEPFTGNQISISPNPFGESINVDVPTCCQALTLTINNHLGQRVIQAPLQTGNQAFNTQLLPPGIYFWETISNENYKQSGKIIKFKNR